MLCTSSGTPQGRYDEAIQFVTDVSAARSDLTERLQDSIGDAKLVALILGKVSLADERDVRLRVMDDSHICGPVSDVSQVLTVVGNLIDNAIDATAQAPGPRWVELTIVAVEHDLLVRVRDSGYGVPHNMREAIFMDGVTTKTSTTGARRGLGLALVRKVVESRGGMISVGHDGGAVFTAVLPAVPPQRAARARPAQRQPGLRRAAGPGPAGRRKGPVSPHAGGRRAAARLRQAGIVGRGGRGVDGNEPGHGAALPQPPARDRARRDQAPLRQRRASGAPLPVVPGR